MSLQETSFSGVANTGLTCLQCVARISRWLGVAWIVLSLPLAWWDLQGRLIIEARAGVSLFKLWIFWATWATLPLLLDAAIQLLQASCLRMQRWAKALWAAGLLLVAYSGLLEPRLLQVHTHRITLQASQGATQAATSSPAAQPLRIALVADMHVGLFVRNWQLERLVNTLNALDVDAVVVAGDWTYEPQRDLLAGWAPLKRVRHPLFGVLGNHDTQAPGPDLASALQQALQHNGVQLLDGQTRHFKGWELVGLSDLWGGNPRAEIAQLLQPTQQPATAPRLIVMHQPDTAALLPPAQGATLMVSGHTHGGQIMLPWITRRYVLPGMSAQGWFEGHYRTAAGDLFVTAGTGTIGLPARLGVVPRVDVLHLKP
ncbi:MAG: metallophosphoesterase [Brachymonas sp.]|nr:metallophosphoesterase [Brachymonas sp.]